MAKVNARGAHAVASLTLQKGDTRRRYVLRSDGALLDGIGVAYKGIHGGAEYRTWPSIALRIRFTIPKDQLATGIDRLKALADNASAKGLTIITREGC